MTTRLEQLRLPNIPMQVSGQVISEEDIQRFRDFFSKGGTGVLDLHASEGSDSVTKRFYFKAGKLVSVEEL